MNTEEHRSPSVCAACGTRIPAEAPGGLCPACVLSGSQTELDPKAGEAPSVEQIAEAFPEFEIVGLIGRGGMGAVYHARQPKLDRDLALKVLLPDLGTDPAFAERFSREARALAKLNHPNIVAVYDFGERDDLFFLAMEYVDGVNLRQAMEAGRFTPEQALAVVPGICDALGAAHALGILHRDIKPENILLDREGKVKIVDFGIARIVGDSVSDFTLTEAGAVLGSRQYMAPEQVERSHEVDHRADIYSLGVVFYELLTGELPIGRFLPPSEKVATHRDVDAIVMRALEKELDRRFQDVGEVKTEVQSAGSEAKARASRRRRTKQNKPRMARLTKFALGMVLGGILLMGSSFLIPARGIPIIFTGLATSLVGYVASWFALARIRKGKISPVGRRWLVWVAIACPSVAVAVVVSLYSSVIIDRDRSGHGRVYAAMIATALITYLVALFCVRRTGFVLHTARGWRWALAVLAVYIATVGFFAALKDREYSHAGALAHGTVQLPALANASYHPQALNKTSIPNPALVLRKAIDRAAGSHLGRYDITNHGDAVKITVAHRSWHPMAAGDHVKAFSQDLLDALPAEAIVGSTVNWGVDYGRLSTWWLFYFGLLGGVAGAGFALLNLRTGLIGMLSICLAGVVMIALPALPPKEWWLRPVDGPPSLPLDREPHVADYSSPEAAARTVIEAAIAGDRELLLKSVSKKLPDFGAEVLVDGLLKSFGSHVRFLRMRRMPGVYDPEVGIRVEVIRRDGKGSRRGGSYSGWFVDEGGDWKLAVSG